MPCGGFYALGAVRRRPSGLVSVRLPARYSQEVSSTILESRLANQSISISRHMDQRKHSSNALGATGMSRSEACTPDSEHLTHVEYELEKRLQFEKLLAELSATFVNLSSEETYDRSQ